MKQKEGAHQVNLSCETFSQMTNSGEPGMESISKDSFQLQFENLSWRQLKQFGPWHWLALPLFSKHWG